jgi:carboxylesterase type B
MASPAAKGLFQRAVIQSIGDCVNIDHKEATQRGTRFAQAAGCGDATDVAACLRSKSPGQIIDARSRPGFHGVPYRVARRNRRSLRPRSLRANSTGHR